jgi:prepilin-type N-terminal cleavage/methylation domain-containing protein
MTNRGNEARKPAARQGVTLIELLVVLLIISLLATAATPVLIARIQEARIATARAETQEIARAEETVALFHGVYVPLQVLDDLPRPAGSTGINTESDNIVLTASSSSVSLIEITRSADEMFSNGQILLDDDGTGLGRRVVDTWKGPFMNFNRFWVGVDGVYDPTDTSDLRFDHPLDPWGSPYRFASPAGLIGSGANGLGPDYSANSFSDGQITSTFDVAFERYAILSLGPNGVFGNTNTLSNDFGDDVVYFFGIDPNESTFDFSF